MTITRQRANLCANIFLMTLMFSGYILTTGLEIFESDSVKSVIRILVILTAISIVISDQRINIFSASFLYLISLLFIINHNIILINIIFLIIISMSINKIEEKYSSIVFLLSSIFSISIHILLVLTGFVDSSSVDVGERTRSALGFANPNQFALVYLTLIFSSFFVYVKFRTKLSFSILVLSYALSIYMMIISDSRTSLFSVLILTTIFFTLSLIFKIKGLKKITIYFIATFPILAFLITIFISNIDDPIIDFALSYRPRLFAEFLSSVNFSDFIFGWNPPNEGNVDNAYLMLLSAFGFPVLIIFLSIVSVSFLKIDKNLLPITTVIIIASIFESFLVRPEIPLAVMMFSIIFRNYGGGNQKNHPIYETIRK